MRIKLIIIAAILSLTTNCSNRNKRLSSINRESRYITLFKDFREIQFETLKVFTPIHLEFEHDFSGRPIRKDNFFLTKTKSNELDRRTFYACLSFQIDSNTIGLITREPSTFSMESSLIVLHLYDGRRDTVNFRIELSDIYFSDTFQFDKRSTLIKEADLLKVVTVFESSFFDSIENTHKRIDSTITVVIKKGNTFKTSR